MIEPVPHPEHDAFDALCQELEEYEALPSMPHPQYEPQDTPYLAEHPEEELDHQILAGLITP